MLKRSFLLFLVLFLTFSFAGEYDKDIVVKNQSRNDKVKTVFREMMNAYEEEDIGQFFSFVSEDRFQQDYMTFYDAIDEDMRIYDILNIDTWVNKITEDGVKRFLEVQWEKRYESSKRVYLNSRDFASSSEFEIIQRGTTEFLFDEINGKYKLIKIAGNNFWGGSLKEWTDEVGDIAGQESKDKVGYCDYDTCQEFNTGGGQPTADQPTADQPAADEPVADEPAEYELTLLPDLIVSNVVCGSSSCDVEIENTGSATANGMIVLRYGIGGPVGADILDTECGFDLASGDTANCTANDQGYGLLGDFEVNPEHENGIEESEYGNNCWQGNCPSASSTPW